MSGDDKSNVADQTEGRTDFREAVEIRHDYYRQLFTDARANRNLIRNSLATPVAATAFSVFNLGTLAQNIEVSRLDEPLGTAIAALAVVAVLAVMVAVYMMVRVEWHFVHIEPPDLPEIIRIEETVRSAHAHIGNERKVAAIVSSELQDTLTGSYYVGYEDLLIGNARSAAARSWALRLVLLGLCCLAVAFLLLPFHLAGKGS